MRVLDETPTTGGHIGSSLLGVSLSDSDSQSFYSAVLAHVLDNPQADTGWLEWSDSGGSLSVLNAPHRASPVPVLVLAGFPETPLVPQLVNVGSVVGPWAQWCEARGIASCAIAPIMDDDERIGMIGLASAEPDVLGANDLRRLEMASRLAAQARKLGTKTGDRQVQFDEVTRIDNALRIDRVLRPGLSLRKLAQAVAQSLDATYCLLALRRGGNRLTIRSWGGYRPPSRSLELSSWPVADLARCEEAFVMRRPVVLDFDRPEFASEPERNLLFSERTRTAIILPFLGGTDFDGVLLVGEERQRGRRSMSTEHVALMELTAKRVGELLRTASQLKRLRRADRRSQARAIQATERVRLALALHDDVGQPLNALLIRIRWALTQGEATAEDLRVLETAAQDALGAARGLAYGLRNPNEFTDPLEDARRYSEALLRDAGCALSWADDRAGVALVTKTSRELGRVLKESVINVVRHARASAVQVRIEPGLGRLRVTIHDNGVGFVPNSVSLTRHGKGLGLLGNAERLRSIGGVFDIQSSPGGGTLVVVEVPVRPAA